MFHPQHMLYRILRYVKLHQLHVNATKPCVYAHHPHYHHPNKSDAKQLAKSR